MVSIMCIIIIDCILVSLVVYLYIIKPLKNKDRFINEILPGLYAYYCDLITHEVGKNDITVPLKELSFKAFAFSFNGLSEDIDYFRTERLEELKRTVEKMVGRLGWDER